MFGGIERVGESAVGEGAVEQSLMITGHLDIEQAAQLAHRFGMIVDVDVDIAIIVRIAAAAFTNNENRRGLPPAAITAGFIACLQSGIKFFSQLVVRALERSAH